MNYKVISHNYENAGGNCMISVFEVWLPDENRTLFVNVGEDYVSLTTVNHVMSDVQIDDYDAVTIETLSYKVDYDQSDYFDLYRYCLFEHLKKDCKYHNRFESLPFVWLLDTFKVQISAEQREYAEENFGRYFITNGYVVHLHTEGAELELKPVSELPHNSLKDTLTACYCRLQATYDCNHEYMDADDLGELLTTIEDVKHYMTTED